MNEKRFVIDEKTNYKDYPIILDTKTGDWWVIQDTMMGTGKLLDLLNEQQATITHLKKVNGKNFAKRRLLEQDNLVLRNENEQLRKELEKLKLLNESLGLFMNE